MLVPGPALGKPAPGKEPEWLGSTDFLLDRERSRRSRFVEEGGFWLCYVEHPSGALWLKVCCKFILAKFVR